MNHKPVIILGAGGHAKVCLDLLKILHHEVLGFASPKRSQSVLKEVSCIGGDEEVLAYSPEGIWLVNGVGSTGNPTVRKDLFIYFKNHGYHFLTLIHPSAIISQDVHMEEGVHVMAGAIIQPGCRVDENTILNTKASIDHDCKIGKHVHLAPAATLSGNVRVDDECHVGTGANIVQNLHIGEKSIVGAGALVIRDIQKGKTVAGVPAKELN
ncbi:MAG TPA: acetyltransferase [Bacillales bacterium]|nr:acetyltransferase [Bacillales bacterium]